MLGVKYHTLWFEGEQKPNNIVQNIEDLPVPEKVDIEMHMVQCESDESDYESDSD